MLSSDQLRTSCNMSTPTQIGYFFAHKITCNLFPFLLSSDEQIDPEHHFHVNRSCHLIEQPSCGVNCCPFFLLPSTGQLDCGWQSCKDHQFTVMI